MAFDPDKYLKSKGMLEEKEGGSKEIEQPKEFDPDSYLTSKNIPVEGASQEVSMPESALEGAKQGLTFGFADEIGGLIGAGLEGASMSPESGESKMDQLKRVYQEYRDMNRARAQRAEEANPKTFMAGDIGASLLMPGAALKGSKRGADAVKAAMLTGSLTGGIEAAGRSEDDLTKDVAMGMAGGGIFGGLLGKLGQKFSKSGLEAASKELSEEANISALKSIGAKAKDIKDELGLKTNKRASIKSAKGSGQTLIDEGLLKMRQGSDELKEDIVSKLNDVAENRIAPLAKQADELTLGIDPSDSFNKFANNVAESGTSVLSSSKYAKSADKALYSDMDKLSTAVVNDVQSALSSENKISNLADIKRKLQKEVNWNDPQASAYNEYLVKMQSEVSNLIDDITSKASPELGEQIKQANKTYSNLLRSNEISGNQLAKDLATPDGISFQDYISSGVISGITRVPGLGPATIAAKKGIEKVTGKSTGKLLNTYQALRASEKSKELAERAIAPSLKDTVLRQSGALSAAGVASGAAMLDDQKQSSMYEANKEMGSYIKNASPETLDAAASKIEQEYGESGTKLANTLRKVSEKDPQGRNALMFSILQDPANRKMLGMTGEE